ncbi:MAG: CHAP domain-containing protein [Anaerolineaceae bacterium]|nr:CHAP domain-containing protein [Anaerolineaceae bacterium]
MFYNLIRFSLLLVLLGQAFLPASAVRSAPEQTQVTVITLAGEQVELKLPFSTANFIQAEADDAQQVATSASWDPFFEVSLAVERLPAAGASKAADIKKSLQTLRTEQAGVGLPAHRLQFFGNLTASTSNQVELNLRPTMKEDVVVHEWVTQVDDLTWTFRVSFTPGEGFDADLLDQIVVRRVGLVPTLPFSTPVQVGSPEIESAANLPTPTWWNGDCDTNYYKAQSGISAYALGGSYRGVKDCGPRPWYDNAPDVLVRFYSGAWGEYEWECVELSMRYLYLAYGISPYSGNGKDVVANYPGSRLLKITNGTIGQAPQPGDVLSYGPTTTYGHTSVVSASNVDSSGDGTITVIEQNSSATGSKTLTVSDWVVQASTTVSGWLHDPVRTVNLPYRIYIPVALSQ